MTCARCGDDVWLVKGWRWTDDSSRYCEPCDHQVYLEFLERSMLDLSARIEEADHAGQRAFATALRGSLEYFAHRLTQMIARGTMR